MQFGNVEKNSLLGCFAQMTYFPIAKASAVVVALIVIMTNATAVIMSFVNVLSGFLVMILVCAHRAVRIIRIILNVVHIMSNTF